MRRESALTLLFSIAVGASLVRADNLVGKSVRLTSADTLPPFDQVSVVDDFTEEFRPFAQLSLDLFADNTFAWRPIVDATFVTYDFVLAVVDPNFQFTGVSLIDPLPASYSLSFDALTHSIVIHHNLGLSGPNDIVRGSFAIVPEPGCGLATAGALVLIGMFRQSRS